MKQRGDDIHHPEKEKNLEEILQFQWSKKNLKKSLHEDIYFFAEKLIRGSIEHLDSIDRLIENSAEHFKPSRILPVDQSILRFSVYALLFQKEISPAIIINEAIELARKFCGDESFRFINGILDGIHRQLQTSQKELFSMKETIKQPIKLEIKPKKPLRRLKQGSVQKGSVQKGQKLLVLFFAWILTNLPLSLIWSQQSEILTREGEIILGEVEYLDEIDERDKLEQKKQEEAKTIPPVRTQTKSVQPSISSQTTRLEQKPTVELTSELLQRVRTEIQNLFQIYLSQIPKNTTSKQIKNQVRTRNYELQILSIRVGNDQPRQKFQNSILPITITVLSPTQYREAKLQLFAKNRETQVSELIYEIERFQLNQHWSQDQLMWRGTFHKGTEVLKLPPGVYDIQCSIEVLVGGKKKISRFWGKGLSQYYVQIK